MFNPIIYAFWQVVVFNYSIDNHTAICISKRRDIFSNFFTFATIISYGFTTFVLKIQAFLHPISNHCFKVCYLFW